MARIKMQIKCTELVIMQEILEILTNITKDKRIEPSVREEYLDKLNDVFEKER